MLLRCIPRAALAAAMTLLLPFALPGQSIKDRIKRRAEQSVGRRIDKAVDCVMGDKKCIEEAKKDGKEVNIVPAKDTTPKAPTAGSEKPAAGGAASASEADAMRPGEGAWANYDFKPGERILYADDYTKDEVGDFPRALEFVLGAMEIVEWKGTRYLRATNTSKFEIVLKQPLAERYTLEFDLTTPHELWIYPSGDEQKDRLVFMNGARVAYHNPGHPDSYTEWLEPFRDKMYRARVMADGRYIKLYINDRRMMQVPNASAERGSKILFYLDAQDDHPALIGPIRLAAGGRKLYDALAEKGRVATQGIYFDTGSDRIRPESSPTLREIVAMLKEHGELALTIEGHTDNVGNAASNQSFSEKRAAAVVAYLVAEGIDASRLLSKGFGSTKPADSNDTPEGRQNNRRVELVKQ